MQSSGGYKKRKTAYSRRDNPVRFPLHRNIRTKKILGRAMVAKGQTWTFNLRYLAVNALTSTAGGLITYDVLMYSPDSATDWANLTTLFDQYRVNKLSVTIIPQDPSVDTTTASTQFYRGLYKFVDNDSTVAAVTTVDQAIQYDDFKIFEINRKFTYACFPPRAVQAQNVGTMADIHGWLDCATSSANNRGYMGLIGNNFKASTSYADALVEWVVEFRMRR